MSASPTTSFALPETLTATSPPESRGLSPDGVRLMVVGPGSVRHERFWSFADHLSTGDVLVVNTSATVPAALDGTRPDGRGVAVHVSSPLADGDRLVELRCEDGSCRIDDARAGERIDLASGAVTLWSAHPDPALRRGSRLWRAAFEVPTDLDSYLACHGRPISYGYVPRRWPLADYQTVFARLPGSAEMPSAGRPFSERVVLDLVAAGVDVVPVLLHTGVSSLEAGEVPLPEWYEVGEGSAQRIEAARRAGGRVVAVGTTVARALESAVGRDGHLQGRRGWTDLVLGGDRPARVVDGLVTGWHEPQASHLLLLEAVAGAPLVQAAYDAAVQEAYLWHEFGDSALLLP